MKFIVIFSIIFILIILILYHLYNIEIIRYYNIVNLPRIEYYDNKYQYLKRVSFPYRVVITLTTIPGREKKLRSTLSSLLDSTRKVDEICINIPIMTKNGKKYKIPNWLSSLKYIKIYQLEYDYGPSSKCIPTLQRENNPNTLIITVDDDVIYGSKMAETYVKIFKQRNYKDALTVFGASIRNNKDVDYGLFPTYFNFRGPYYIDTLMGHNSFCFQRWMFPKEVYDYSNAPKEAFYVDDIWFSGWLKYNNVNIWSIGYKSKFIPISFHYPHEKKIGLCETVNRTEHNNQTTIKYFVHDIGINFSN